jgi:uncharacterized protein
MSLVAFPRLLAYGDDGFRFSDGRRGGSVMVVNGVVGAWPRRALGEVTAADFDPVFSADPRPDFLLLGVGSRVGPAPADIRERFRAEGLGLEVMDTPAACRVYTTLVGEGRRFAAALIAVR